MESGDNQPLQIHVTHVQSRVGAPYPLIKGGGWPGQCMFVLLFAHFFHYFISFRPPAHTSALAIVCLRFFIIRYLFYRSLHFQRMGGEQVVANGLFW